ncbi:hypothetical protein CF319_g6059 [Tilletia indica]|uniref:Vacuolar protein sorting-associated protein 51 homolog n=1 Tax=Tilletia indica TaxID=43049 RepID=A0A177TLR4_9BASI|nr:hypothetical protein CF319_g6059 [Tilletia indica]KAE8245442.1 hypothetical protein A4X13_0g5916 [Tilletia indica]
MAATVHAPTASGAASPVRQTRAEANSAASGSAAAAVTGAPGGGGAAAGGGRASKRALRDYYGIQSAGLDASTDGTQSSGTFDSMEPGASTDPHNPDSPAFNVSSCYESLVSTMGLAELLRKSAELVSEIRELDGEKQSLVYNHHHELVAASETIRKMKNRADGLDPSLDSLQSSFSTMSQLAETLALPPHLTESIVRSQGTASQAVSTGNQ